MVQPVMTHPTPFWDDPARMIPVDEARARILAAFAPTPVERVPLTEALGLVLAGNLIAGHPLPPFANSAMDGFAVRAADTTAATLQTPTRLRVVGQAAAGYEAEAGVGPGEAVRIMTGAPLPAGADAVVRFEDTDEAARYGAAAGSGEIAVNRAVTVGTSVRLAGEDVRHGETVIVAGARVRPAEIGMLAALGRPYASVYRRPRVAILATGDELVDGADRLRPGQIRNSNGPMIAALVQRTGGIPVPLGIARDDDDDLRAKLAAGGDVDMILTIGGVSTGDYDRVKQVLRADGRIDLWQVRIKPGKPLAFGWLDGRPLIGLPGNPAAAAVAFEQFVRPAILTLLGHKDRAIPTIQARLRDRIENRGGRRQFVRVRVNSGPTGFEATLAGAQGAGSVAGLVHANGLLVIPETTPVAEPGAEFPVQMTEWDMP